MSGFRWINGGLLSKANITTNNRTGGGNEWV